MSDPKEQVDEKGAGASLFGRIAEGLRGAIFEEEVSSSDQDGKTGALAQPVNEVARATTLAVNENPMRARLHQAVMSRNTGFSQLLGNMQALEAVITDESSRLRAAFAILQKNGISLLSLVQDVELHLRDLETQTIRFRDEAATERKQRVGVHESAVVEKKAFIEQVQAQIAQQQKTIADEEAKLAELTLEIQRQTAELDQAESFFAAANEHEHRWLLQQSEKIKGLESQSADVK